ncbi:sensor histidine kinase [Ruminiclostridium josui]|uniref:sensor histidine kinase n=1 Tax=Ruminiclostridium josui TaxID=1499 RepID=UPI000467CBA0|nr:ATP-binding protein [Ruminiclostridium josui]
MIKTVFNELIIGYPSSKKITLQIEEPIPCLLTDSVMIKQVITNIISNSLKFTSNKDDAKITAGYYYENDENIFYIKDNGVGFDMKFSENLFKMFHRMHSVDEFEGSGIGLALVKKIIMKLGGRVWITGEVGKGVCVYFTLKNDNILK